jgi:hypothetical protein
MKKQAPRPAPRRKPTAAEAKASKPSEVTLTLTWAQLKEVHAGHVVLKDAYSKLRFQKGRLVGRLMANQVRIKREYEPVSEAITELIDKHAPVGEDGEKNMNTSTWGAKTNKALADDYKEMMKATCKITLCVLDASLLEMNKNHLPWEFLEPLCEHGIITGLLDDEDEEEEAVGGPVPLAPSPTPVH